jgi:hypothetical protein
MKDVLDVFWPFTISVALLWTAAYGFHLLNLTSYTWITFPYIATCVIVIGLSFGGAVIRLVFMQEDGTPDAQESREDGEKG